MYPNFNSSAIRFLPENDKSLQQNRHFSSVYLVKMYTIYFLSRIISYFLSPLGSITNFAPGYFFGPLRTHCLNFSILWWLTHSGYVKIEAISSGTATWKNNSFLLNPETKDNCFIAKKKNSLKINKILNLCDFQIRIRWYYSPSSELDTLPRQIPTKASLFPF